jgi:hypothetical protein
MKRFAPFFLLLVMALPAAAIEGRQVKYSGGTVPLLPAGAVGRLDTTSETAVSFEYAGNTFAIPYAKIDSFECHERLARHLGVLPAIFVGLIKSRQRKHFFQIIYHSDDNVNQVAIFEVSKQLSPTLLAVLQSRASQACGKMYVPKCIQWN